MMSNEYNSFTDPAVVKQSRTPRSVAVRENQVRDWAPPSTLPIPEPIDGYSFRWVRVGSRGQNDLMNLSSRSREGFEPVRAEDHPELALHKITEGRFIGGIEVGGLLLCKIPIRNIKQRSEYYGNLTQSQMDSINSQLEKEQVDPRIRISRDFKSSVSFGTGQ